MNIKEVAVSDLKPYENNPRKNDGAVDAVKKSIELFGFKVPIVIDSENVIIAGHTRLKAAQILGIEKVPCVVADDLTPEQVKAFRLIDNKTAELAAWDFEKLDKELAELTNFNFDMAGLGFEDLPSIDWDDIEDLTEESYSEPKQKMLKCPSCGHTAGSSFFKKV